MKNILLIIPYGGVGGMERLALYLFEHYKQQGYTVKAVKVIKLKSDIINFGEDEYFLSDLDLCEMKFFSRLFFYCKAPFLVRRIIKKNKFDYSIAFGDMSNVISSLSFTNEYKIASIHALKSVEFTNDTFLNRIFKLAFRSSYFYLDKVICISQAIKEDLIINCGFRFTQKLKVIYNPHNVLKMSQLSLMPFESKEELALFNKQVVLFLGRLSIQKSPWHLVKAFSLAAQHNDDLVLVFIGDGDQDVEKYLFALIEKLGIKEKVFFLGRKSNPFMYLKKAAVLALSSFYEGTPNVIVEAIATGIPVVTSNCTDGIIELMSSKQLEKNGNLLETESGIITPNFFKGALCIPEDDDYIAEEYDFAHAITLLTSRKSYKEKILLNKEILLRKFNISHVAKEYLKS